MRVAVVTPTIASEHLAKCIDSVDKQTYQDITFSLMVVSMSQRRERFS